MFARGAKRAMVAALGIIAATLAGSATPAQASPYNGYATSCSSASPSTEVMVTDLSWSEFASQDSILFGVGFRISQLDIAGHGVTAVWQPGSGEQRVRWNMSLTEFKDWDTHYFNQGLRLAELDRDGGSWAAVWRPGSGEQRWRSGISSWLDFKNQDQVFFNQGLRLVDVIITADDNITAVWRGDQGNAAQYWEAGIPAANVDSHNESDFGRINRLRQQAGYELRILRTHPNDSYAMGVWRFRGGSFSQQTDMYLQDGLSAEAICKAQGRHMVSLDVK